MSLSAGEGNLLAILKQRWWKYMILGLIDIEANYLVLKAYQYTTLPSVQVRMVDFTLSAHKWGASVKQ